MQTGQELLQKWDARAPRLYLRMEVTGEGLVLGARTILAKMARDERGAPFLFLEDEQRTIALLTTAYQRPFEPYLLAKLSRACELWSENEKALAHIHLAHAGLPPCDEGQALRLFVAEELLESETTPHTLLKAQGFDTAALDLSKFSPAQPRVPSGNRRESGQWTSGDADISPVAFRSPKERRATEVVAAGLTRSAVCWTGCGNGELLRKTSLHRRENQITKRESNLKARRLRNHRLSR